MRKDGGKRSGENTGEPADRAGLKALRHRIFQAGVMLKGIDGVLETAGGLLVLFASPRAIGWAVHLLTQRELSEDPSDAVANALIKAASQISLNERWFAFLYLVSHGVVKSFLAVSLLKRRLWSYPAAIVFFALFTVYQLYRYILDRSPGWLALSVLDLFIIALTWLEYRALARTD